MIAGIICAAVAEEMVLSHPTGHVEPELTAVAVGGVCLYMFGNAVFNSRITHAFPKRRTITLLAVAAVIPFAHWLTPLLLMAWIITPLICLAVLDGVTKPPPYRDESGDPEADIPLEQG
jgi:low temperature requirement protein LtrA